jgi:hypothetical protein
MPKPSRAVFVAPSSNVPNKYTIPNGMIKHPDIRNARFAIWYIDWRLIFPLSTVRKNQMYPKAINANINDKSALLDNVTKSPDPMIAMASHWYRW